MRINNRFEMIKGLHLEVDPFPEHILTPSLKVKRPFAAKHYKEHIDRIYGEGTSLFDGKESKL